MLAILGYGLLVLAALVALVVLYASTKPDSFTVERSAVIKAAPDTIFAFIEDFRKWEQWSPWEKLDPGMTKSFSGPATGKGAVYEWDGNKKVGAGRMEVLDQTAPHGIRIALSFLRPMQSTSITNILLLDQGDATEVVWTMQGPMPLMSKVFCLFMDMDRLIGKDFEAGLATLKSRSEG